MKRAIRELDEFLPHQFYILGRLLRHDLQQKFKAGKHRLTSEQFFIIHRLYFKDAQSQKELADKILQDHPNITRLLDKLEKNGIVQRENGENDRRNFIIKLSPKGRELFEQLIPLIKKWRKEMMAGIDKKAIKITWEIISNIKANIST
jgi:MarR family transcriptional regulator, transcriptional regulator for hemolysin